MTTLSQIMPTEIDIAQRELVGQYLKLAYRIRQKYPRAYEFHNNKLVGIEAFDPPTLNFWESESLTDAIRDDHVMDVLTQVDFDRVFDQETISTRVDMLKNYCIRDSIPFD